MRAVPTASNGFIAATSRKPGSATIRSRRGTCSSRSLITVMSTLSVSSGTRLSSSTYSRAPSRMRRHERAVDEHVGVVALGQHPRRVEVADQPCRRQLGVALDELEPDAELVGDGPQQRRLARARRPFEDDVAAGLERRQHELQLPPAPDQPSTQALQGGAHVSHRSRVDHDAADVLAGPHVVVAVVDAVEVVRLGHQPVEVELAVALELEQLRDVGAGVGRAEQRADHLLLHQRQVEQARRWPTSRVPGGGWSRRHAPAWP